MSGDYSPASGGQLSIPISGTQSPGTDFGQLSVSGTAALSGTLALQTTNGYVPPVGTQYTLLTANNVTGTFSSVTGTQLGDRRYVVSYTPTSVRATVVGPAPTVTGVSPSAGPTHGGTTVTINGSGFTASSTVTFGNVTATSVTYDSSTQLTAVAPAQAAATHNIYVTTSGQTSATVAADQFTYDAVPTVTAVSPAAGPTAGATSVTISGTGFKSGATVTFGTVAATSVTFVSSTTLKAKAPAEKTGAVDVTVADPGGTSATSSADHYTYDPVPTVTGVSPTAGPTAGKTTVTIAGTGFTSGATVKVGTVAATSVTYSSANTLTAVVPPKPPRRTTSTSPPRAGPVRPRQPISSPMTPSPRSPASPRQPDRLLVGTRSRSPGRDSARRDRDLRDRGQTYRVMHRLRRSHGQNPLAHTGRNGRYLH